MSSGPGPVRADPSAAPGARAAALFAEAALQALASRAYFHAALCGGAPLAQMLAALPRLPAFGRIDWPAVQLFAADDGWDAAAMQRLRRLPLPRANLHRPRSADISRPDAARLYEQALRAYFGLAPGQLPPFDFMLVRPCGATPLCDGAHDLARWVASRPHGSPGLMLTATVIDAARRLVLVCDPALPAAPPRLHPAGEFHVLALSTARSSGVATPATVRAGRSGLSAA